MSKITNTDLLSRPKLRAIMKNHEESNLQQQCVAWFREQYPQYAMLMTHPINEGRDHTAQDRRRQGIHKAEGAVAGVPDLLFFLPSYMQTKDTQDRPVWTEVHGLGIEMKTSTGKQSPEQKRFQKMFEAAGYSYHIVKSLEQFRLLVMWYINMSYEGVRTAITETHKQLVKEAEDKEREHFYKVIGKK